MTCLTPHNRRNRGIIIPIAKRYFIKFHTPVFQRVVVVNIKTINYHPPPIKIIN